MTPALLPEVTTFKGKTPKHNTRRGLQPAPRDTRFACGGGWRGHAACQAPSFSSVAAGTAEPRVAPKGPSAPHGSSQARQHESVHLIRREVIVCAHIGRTEEERRATGDLGAKSGSSDTLILEESLCCRSGHCSLGLQLSDCLCCSQST